MLAVLEILSQSKDPLAVQQHLSKCFENINKLEFQKDLCMTAMFSGEGERVPFKTSHYPEGSVEFWMTDILCEMKATVQEQIILSLRDELERRNAEEKSPLPIQPASRPSSSGGWQPQDLIAAQTENAKLRELVSLLRQKLAQGSP